MGVDRLAYDECALCPLRPGKLMEPPASIPLTEDFNDILMRDIAFSGDFNATVLRLKVSRPLAKLKIAQVKRC